MLRQIRLPRLCSNPDFDDYLEFDVLDFVERNFIFGPNRRVSWHGATDALALLSLFERAAVLRAGRESPSCESITASGVG